jgi:Zn-dependent peptidase ImmA (M78 family)
MKDTQKIQIIQDFIKFCYYELGIKKSPKINIINDKNWVKDHTSFGSYNPNDNTIDVYLADRNLADFLRTLAHEITHHFQNQNGEIDDNSGETGSQIENEANAKAGVILRKYGKTNPVIYEQKNKELNILREVIKRIR